MMNCSLLGFNLISIEDDNKTHYWIERDDESKLAPLGYKSGTFRKLLFIENSLI